jgi:hypothetical protein
MKNLVVKAGQTARWQVKIGGKPAPDVKWFKDKNALEMSSQIQIEVKKNEHTILCIPSTVRADRGTYSLNVKNAHGEANASAELTVLDRPGKPRGPLEASNVTENSLDLDWLPPLDNGGCEIGWLFT